MSDRPGRMVLDGSSRWRVAALLVAAAAAGCGGDDEAPSYEPTGGACGTLAAPEAPAPVDDGCIVADTECPAEPPVPGTACTSGLQCTFEEDGPAWGCSDAGRWEPSDFDSAPPFGELCLEPSVEPLPGARVVIGPVGEGPVVPFGDCASGGLTYGPQGGAMVPFRLQVDGAVAPECVLVETRLTVGERTFDGTGNRVALHCGQSLLVYTVVPFELQRFLCGAPDHVVLTLDVSVAGIGAATARILVPTPAECSDEPQTG